MICFQGTGRHEIKSRHCRLWRGWETAADGDRSKPNFQTVAVCDQNFSESGVMPDGVRYHRTYHRLLKESLDVLFVSLPNYLAAEVTVAGLEKDLHVFCEKPPGRDVADVQRVIDALRAASKVSRQVWLQSSLSRIGAACAECDHFGELGEIVNIARCLRQKQDRIVCQRLACRAELRRWWNSAGSGHPYGGLDAPVLRGVSKTSKLRVQLLLAS